MSPAGVHDFGSWHCGDEHCVESVCHALFLMRPNGFNAWRRLHLRKDFFTRITQTGDIVNGGMCRDLRLRREIVPHIPGFFWPAAWPALRISFPAGQKFPFPRSDVSVPSLSIFFGEKPPMPRIERDQGPFVIVVTHSSLPVFSCQRKCFSFSWLAQSVWRCRNQRHRAGHPSGRFSHRPADTPHFPVSRSSSL